MEYTSDIDDPPPRFRPDVLEAIRHVRGLTRPQVAEIAGLRTATITAYEHGKCAPSSRALGALSAALNVPVSAFYRPAEVDVRFTWQGACRTLDALDDTDRADLSRVLVRIDVRDALQRAS